LAPSYGTIKSSFNSVVILFYTVVLQFAFSLVASLQDVCYFSRIISGEIICQNAVFWITF